jgi:cobalt-zinc-cadmium efflux system protein
MLPDVSGHPHRPDATRRLGLVLAITSAYAATEVVGGWLANSLALLADAGHMLADILALALALVAAWTARRPPDPTRTYGFQRVEILAALANGLALLGIAVFILREAWQRFQDPPQVAYGLVAAIAAGGLGVNLLGAGLLHGHQHGLNVRAAYLHVLGDLLGSVGTLLAAGLMAGFGWYWADPAVSAIVALILVVGALRLVLASIHVLLEGAPADLDTASVRECLLGVAGVGGVHDLHLWTLGGGTPLLTAHLVLDHTLPPDRVLRDATAVLTERFGIEHSTLQLEPPDFNIVGALTEAGARRD